MTISDTTIYYLASTIAQVLAATCALSAILIQFKLSEVKRFLIGEGQSAYNRAIRGGKGYKNLGKKDKGRLSDSIGRENLDGIEEVLKVLYDQEPDLRALYNRFTKNRNYYKFLKSSIKTSIIYSLITIIYAILILGLVDIIVQNYYATIFVPTTLLIITLISIYKTYTGITEGLKDKKLK